MPNLKVKKGNDTLTFGLTDNVRDVGDRRLTFVIGGKKYYARLGDTKTAFVVQRTSNGNKSYMQTSPISFKPWGWSKYPTDVRGTEKMFVYLPKGRYRAAVYAISGDSNEFTITESKDIEVNVSVSTGLISKATFNIDGWRREMMTKDSNLSIQIERIGE